MILFWPSLVATRKMGDIDKKWFNITKHSIRTLYRKLARQTLKIENKNILIIKAKQIRNSSQPLEFTQLVGNRCEKKPLHVYENSQIAWFCMW